MWNLLHSRTVGTDRYRISDVSRAHLYAPAEESGRIAVAAIVGRRAVLLGFLGIANGQRKAAERA